MVFYAEDQHIVQVFTSAINFLLQTATSRHYIPSKWCSRTRAETKPSKEVVETTEEFSLSPLIAHSSRLASTLSHSIGFPNNNGPLSGFKSRICCLSNVTDYAKHKPIDTVHPRSLYHTHIQAAVHWFMHTNVLMVIMWGLASQSTK